jgi:WS/DGAT/MGAT family acyltransferase
MVTRLKASTARKAAAQPKAGLRQAAAGAAPQPSRKPKRLQALAARKAQADEAAAGGGLGALAGLAQALNGVNLGALLQNVQGLLGPAMAAGTETATQLGKTVGSSVDKAVGRPIRARVQGEPMSRVDTAWLRMDSEHNLMMIVGVWLLEPAIAYDTLCQRVEERLLKFKRFRQKVVQDAAGATWVTDRKFDIHNHVVRVELPKSKRGEDPQRALEDLCARLAAEPLDPSRPLWQLHLIEHYNAHGIKGSAMVARIHHCIADGIALISVMMSITDGGAAPPSKKPKAAEEDWVADLLLKPLLKAGSMATGVTVKALDVYGQGMARGMAALQDPQKTAQQVGDSSLAAARTAMQLLQDASALALMPDDSPTRLKGKPGTIKRVAWNDPIPLDDVKAIGKTLGCSVNDVLLACVAGAIAAYLHDKGEDVTGKEIRAMVPVNLRPLDKAHQLGNKFGLVPLVLPIGLANPIQRVYEVKARMGELKGSMQPVLAFGILSLTGLMIKPVQDIILNLFAKKATAVMTNVPGPREPLKFCGSTLKQTMFWVPQSGDIGMGVSILSYGGGVQFGLITDSTLCPDPHGIISRFEPEFKKLFSLTAMLKMH